MALPRVSVIVVSHGRPTWLSRCLTAIAQLDYPAFECVIVADHSGLGAVAAHARGGEVKTVHLEEANVSKARNAGIEAAAGDLLAFIDDDAVPEPLWLAHHVAGLASTGADASVGYVRGRNGISFQSRAVSIDREGESHEEEMQSDGFGILRLQSGRSVKLIGTNFTVTRRAAVETGGFDPSFRFYLDDSDFSVRLCAAGYTSAVVPLAEVHHSVAPSDRRTAHRFPTGLRDVARSSAIFLRKHSDTPVESVFSRHFDREKKRLAKHLVRGTCEPRDVLTALSAFRAGWEEGTRIKLRSVTPLHSQHTEFMQFTPAFEGHTVLSSRLWGRAVARQNAMNAVAEGRRATHVTLSPTSVRHHLRFTEEGHWEHRGGLWGPSERVQPWFRWCTFANRVNEECRRVEKQRGIRKNNGVWGN